MPHSRISSQTRQRARELRRNMTEPERRLWRKLREMKPFGFHFRRQAPIGPYVADFALFSNKLVIELDGDTHGASTQQAHDARRSDLLKSDGFTILRISNADVMSSLQSVAEAILDAAQTCARQTPTEPKP